MTRMMKMSAMLAIMACLVVGVAQDPVTIAWKPKAGTTLKYKLEIKPEAPGVDITVLLTVTSKTLEVKDDGKVVVQTTVGNGVVIVNGEEQAIPEEGSSTSVHLPNGEVVESKEEGGMGNARFGESLVVIYPDKSVKSGDQWVRSKKGDAKLGTIDSETTYTYLGEETIGIFKTYKLRYEFKETKGTTPMSVAATIWVSAEDGELVRAEYAMQNVEFQPGMPPMNATSKMSRAG